MDWRTYMKSFFPKEYREVTTSAEGKSCMADVLMDGIAVEFQNSPISEEEFKQRTFAYTRDGKEIIWVFDISEQIRSGYMEITQAGETLIGWWKRPFKVLKNLYWDLSSSRCRAHVFFSWLDEGCPVLYRVQTTWGRGYNLDFRFFFLNNPGVLLHTNMSVRELLSQTMSQSLLGAFAVQPNVPCSVVTTDTTNLGSRVNKCPKTGRDIHHKGTKTKDCCRSCRHCVAIVGDSRLNSYCIYPNITNNVANDGDYKAPLIYGNIDKLNNVRF